MLLGCNINNVVNAKPKKAIRKSLIAFFYQSLSFDNNKTNKSK